MVTAVNSSSFSTTVGGAALQAAIVARMTMQIAVVAGLATRVGGYSPESGGGSAVLSGGL